jgi:hypothetical protein
MCPTSKMLLDLVSQRATVLSRIVSLLPSSSVCPGCSNACSLSLAKAASKRIIFLVAILGVPITVAYWTLMSIFGPRKNEKVALPGKDIEEYITIHDPELKARYHHKEKIPMQTFHDAYFDSKIDFNG